MDSAAADNDSASSEEPSSSPTTLLLLFHHGRPAGHSVLPLSFIFFRRLIPEVAWRIVTKLGVGKKDKHFVCEHC